MPPLIGHFALCRTMKNLYELLSAGEVALFDWGKFRWYEGFVPLLHLYARRPEEWMLDLGRILRQQGADYPSFVETRKTPLNKWTFHTHIVNLCMKFKYEAVACALQGDDYTNQAEALCPPPSLRTCGPISTISRSIR